MHPPNAGESVRGQRQLDEGDRAPQLHVSITSTAAALMGPVLVSRSKRGKSLLDI
jgi:hypothetical protein